MKNTLANYQGATVALFFGGVIGGLAPIAAKVALQELGPFTTLFLRLSIMMVILLPFVMRSFRHYISHWKRLLVLGMFWAGNVTLFIVGVKYTTAAVSQMVYAGVPIYVVLENYLIWKERVHGIQIVGILLGLIGAFFLIVTPGLGAGLGTLYGNGLIAIAALSWSLYTVVSKRISIHVSPLGITSTSALVAWVVSLIFMFVFERQNLILNVLSLSFPAVMAIVFMGVVVGVGMIFLYQWGLKYGSALMATMTAYVSIIVAGVAGFFVFSERLTGQFFLGGAFIIIGVFLVGSLPLLRRGIS